jgi:hypothetical protein
MYLRGWISADDINVANADMNGDGIVDWEDFYLLEVYLGFGLNNRFDISLHMEVLMEVLFLLEQHVYDRAERVL